MYVDSEVSFYKIVGEFLIRQLGEYHLFAEVRGQVVVGLGDNIKSSLGKGVHSGNVASPLAEVWQLSATVLDIGSSFLGTGTEIMPVILGMGMRCTRTEP